MGNVQNNCLDTYLRAIQAERDVTEVGCDQANQQDYIGFTPEAMEEIIRRHTHQDLQWGKEHGKHQFEFDRIEQEVRERFLFGRKRLNHQIKVFEFSGDHDITGMLDIIHTADPGISQDPELHTENVYQEFHQFEGDQDLKKALRTIEECIIFLHQCKITTDMADLSILVFCRDFLQMSREEYQVFDLKSGT